MIRDQPNLQQSENSAANWLPDQGEPGLVSILVPTFNRAPFLSATLDSILAQTYENIEVVVVNDGSTDDTHEILVTWKRRFEQERGWRLVMIDQQNQGGPAARNRAARESRGEWLNFFDDDDLMATEMISARMQELSRCSADFIYGPYAMFTTEGSKYWLGQVIDEKPGYGNKDPLASWLEGWDWGLTTSLIARTFVRQIGPWNEVLHRGQDLEYKLRMLAQSPQIAHASQGLALVRHHAASVTFDHSLRAQNDLIEILSRAEKCVIEKFGHNYCACPLAEIWSKRAIRCYQEGAVSAGQLCVEKSLSHNKSHRPELTALFEKLCFRITGYRALGWARRVRKQLSFLTRRFLGFSGGTLKQVESLPLNEPLVSANKPMAKSIS